MKVTISSEGVLIISTESTMENYAISQWYDYQCNELTNPSSLMIDIDLYDEEE